MPSVELLTIVETESSAEIVHTRIAGLEVQEDEAGVDENEGIISRDNIGGQVRPGAGHLAPGEMGRGGEGGTELLDQPQPLLTAPVPDTDPQVGATVRPTGQRHMYRGQT